MVSDRSAAGRAGRARGARKENAVAALSRADGWVVASMRTAAGGGDLMRARARSGVTPPGWANAGAEVQLVEVKSTAGGPFERFGPADRRAMLEVADRAGADAFLAWYPPRSSVPIWIPADEWPNR